MKKRIAALLLSGVLCVGLAGTAFAAEETVNKAPGTIGDGSSSFIVSTDDGVQKIIVTDENGQISSSDQAYINGLRDTAGSVTISDGGDTTVIVEKQETPPPSDEGNKDEGNKDEDNPPDYRPSYPSSSGSDASGYSKPTIPTGGVNFPSNLAHGTIKTSATRADAGQKVIIVASPKTGYKLDSLTVTDYYGNTMEVTPVSGDRYSFIMPETSVTIDAVFVLGSTNQNTTVTPTTGLPYSDVALTDWYLNAVQYMYRNGIMTGTSTTTFSPAQTVDRASVVTMLHRLEGSPVSGAATFPDVAAGQWYTAAVAWAASNNVVTGNETGNFAPANTITRQDLAVILYRYAQLKGYSVDAATSLSGYTDAGQISDYAQEAMQWANAAGLITGTTTTTLNPQGSASRAEVATILMRFCMNVAYR